MKQGKKAEGSMTIAAISVQVTDRACLEARTRPQGEGERETDGQGELRCVLLFVESDFRVT